MTPTPQKAPTIAVELVTPERAAQMLGTMAANRNLRNRAVMRYAREMIAGKWLLNGEAIKFGVNGKLIDGQHRLHAVMMAKVPVLMHVVRGVDEHAMITLDTGVGRSFNDFGVLSGKSYTNAVGPIAAIWYKYQSGSPNNSNLVPTHQELQALVDAHPSIAESAGFIGRHKVLRTRCVASVQGFVHAYATEKYDRELADLFMENLNDGAGLDKESAIYHLRRRLVDEVSTASIATRRIERSHALALTIKAWNLWMEGAKIGNLRWRTGGDQPEEFPRFTADNPKAQADAMKARKYRQGKKLAGAA